MSQFQLRHRIKLRSNEYICEKENWFVKVELVNSRQECSQQQHPVGIPQAHSHDKGNTMKSRSREIRI